MTTQGHEAAASNEPGKSAGALRRGPWVVVAGVNPNDKNIHDASFGHYGTTFAKVSFAHEYSHMPAYGAKMAAEYARLVAAAPDMLAALQALAPHLDKLICYASTRKYEPNEAVFLANAAIAKATEAA